MTEEQEEFEEQCRDNEELTSIDDPYTPESDDQTHSDVDDGSSTSSEALSVHFCTSSR